MKTYTITFNAPENADLDRAIRFAEMASDPDYLLSVWHTDDVKNELDDDLDLTDEQCREVLLRVCDEFDANIGINWGVIRHHIEVIHNESKKGSK